MEIQHTMNKELIADLLEEKNLSLIDFLENQAPEKWLEGPKGKWTTGEVALHLLQSIKPLNDALSMPKFLLRLKFGKYTGAIRDYETIVHDYLERLKAQPSFTFKASRNMRQPSLKDKKYILCRLQMESKKLQYKTKRISDTNLDTVLLPHPLLGKIPVRELIMWTAYHMEHHTKILQEKY